MILAHNYQVPEVQDVADFVGDSLGLSRQAAAAGGDVIAFCGVHFMAETASILCPEKTVLLPDLDAGCSLADSITADELRAWKAQHPGAVVVMYVNTTAEVKAETDYCCTSSNAVQVVEHIWREHGEDTEILFGPDMFLGAYVEKVTGRRMNVWTGECHVHAGIRPSDIAEVREANPGADFLIHPECGCSTSVMEYVAAGDVDAENTHMLSTGGMLTHARESDADTFIVATETGMLHPLERDNPARRFVPANEAAVCQFMKMITLPKLRDCLRDLDAGGEGRPRDRRAGAGADRAHGRDRLRSRPRLSRSGLAGARSPLPEPRAAAGARRPSPSCRSPRAARPEPLEPEPLLPEPLEPEPLEPLLARAGRVAPPDPESCRSSPVPSSLVPRLGLASAAGPERSSASSSSPPRPRPSPAAASAALARRASAAESSSLGRAGARGAPATAPGRRSRRPAARAPRAARESARPSAVPESGDGGHAADHGAGHQHGGAGLGGDRAAGAGAAQLGDARGHRLAALGGPGHPR